MYQTDCVVVGAGVVGLAVARALALAGREVVVLEREGLIGSHTSSRNSEVIHAGIYYPRGSAKARLCVAGRDRLYAYAEAPRRAAPAAGQDHRGGGAGAGGGARGDRRGGGGERGRGARAARGGAISARLEPALRGAAGLLSPMTGIVDSHALMLRYQGEAEDHGAALALRTRLVAAEATGGGDRRRGRERRRDGAGSGRGRWSTPPGSSPARWRRPPTAWPPEHRREIFYCKGNYFSVAARVPFRHLVYPVPERDGLGVHLTLDMAGQGRFGPDTEWIAGHRLRPRRHAAAPASTKRSAATGRICPTARSAPSYTGIRPKLFPPGGAGHRLRHRGAGGARGGGARQPLRHREPGPDRVARHRRRGGGAAGGLNPSVRS